MKVHVFSQEGVFVSKILTQKGGYWNSYDDNNQEQLQRIGTTDDHLIILWKTSINSVRDSKIKVFSKSGALIHEFGSIGSDGGQFYDPIELATDSIGNIYVSDYKKIHRFTETGAYISSLDYTTANNFIVEPSGNYVITDYYKIRRIDETGQTLTLIDGRGNGEGQFEGPTDVVIDSKNNMYVMDYGNGRIQKFDENGNFVLQFGSRGDFPDQFWNPYIIQVSPIDEVLILDLNGKVIKYDSLGNFIRSFGKQATIDVEFTFLRDFDLDSEGNIYVLESSSNQSASVQKFSSTGQFLAKWGESGLEEGQFYEPKRIEIDHENDIYIVNGLPNANDQLLKFDSEGNFLSQINNIGYPNDLETDKYGNIYSFNG